MSEEKVEYRTEGAEPTVATIKRTYDDWDETKLALDAAEQLDFTYTLEATYEDCKGLLGNPSSRDVWILTITEEQEASVEALDAPSADEAGD